MKKFFGIIAAFALLSSTAALSKADFSIGLVNTGVNVVGNVDQSYDYTYNGGSSADAQLQSPIHPNWIQNEASAASKWITSTPGDSQPEGLYVFTTVFNLPVGTLLDTVQIAGRWATDNGGVMKINGNAVTSGSISPGGSYDPFATWTSFSIQDFFVIGNNVLTFEVTNLSGSSGNPTGLRVEMQGTYATPEPATIVVWSGLAAIGGIVAYRRRVAA